MRHAILIRSVRKYVGPDGNVLDAVYMWSRHRLMVPYAALAFLALVLVAAAAGIDPWPSRVAIGAAGAAVAAAATTEYRVLALTGTGLVLLRGSRVRHYATGVMTHLPAEFTPRREGGNMLTSDWMIDGSVYTVLKRDDQALASMAASPGVDPEEN